jgi:hypothetical protein
MKAAAVLALVLSFVTPPVVWTAAPEASPKAGSVSLAAPTTAACALVRSAAKAEKTFSTDWAAMLDRRPPHPVQASAVARLDGATSLSHLDLDNPPLAPRPPPFSQQSTLGR